MLGHLECFFERILFLIRVVKMRVRFVFYVDSGFFHHYIFYSILSWQNDVFIEIDKTFSLMSSFSLLNV